MQLHTRAASQTVSGHPAKLKNSPNAKSRSNKENALAAQSHASPTSAAGNSSSSGLKQPSTIPRPSFKASTASSRHKQLSTQLHPSADAPAHAPSSQQPPAREQPPAALAPSNALPKPTFPIPSSTSLRRPSEDLTGSSLIPSPSPSQRPTHSSSSSSSLPSFSSTSSTLAAIPQTPIQAKRDRLTFADLSSLPQSERDSHRERLIADLSAHTPLTSSLTSLYPATLDAELDAALRFKVTAKRFDYKPKIEQLQRHIDLLRAALTQLTDRREQLHSMAAEVEGRWHGEQVMSHTKVFDLSQKLYHHTATIKQLQAQLKSLQAEKEAMMRDLSATMEGKEKVEIVVKEYERAKEALARRIEQLEGEVRDYERKVEEMVAARDDMTQVLFNQEKEITAVGEAKRRVDEEARQLHERVQALELELGEAKENIYNLEKLRGELIKSMEKSLGDLTKARAEGVEKDRVVEELRKMEARQAQVIDGLKAGVTKGEKERRELEERMEALRAEWTERHLADTERLTSELSLLRKVKDDELQSLRAKLSRKDEEMSHLQATYADVDETKKAIATELTATREAVLKERKERTAMEHGYVRVREELKYAEMELEGKKEELRLIAQSREKERRLEDERREEAKRAKEEAEAKAAALTDDLKARDRELKSAAGAHASLSASHADLQAAHAELGEARAALQVREEVLSGQVSTLTSELSALTERSTRELSCSQAESADWRRRHDEMDAELESFKRYAGVSDKDQLERLVRLSVEAEVLRKQVADKGEVASRLMDTERRLGEATRKVYEGERKRRELHNVIQELKGNVRVMVRVRPGADVEAVECCDDEKRLKVQGEEKQTAYSFDHVFAPSTKQADVFDEVSSLIQSALDGYHVCLFSYGQTGSGKTHTMSGALSGEGAGIIPRSVTQILHTARAYREEGWTFTLEASFLEIYNEQVRDLLSSKGMQEEGGAGLEVKRDADGRTLVPGSVRMVVTGEAEIVEVLKLAAKHRSVAATSMNARSSRSHSIFTLYLNGSNSTSRTHLTGSLNLCDLAGSERLSKSHAEGARLKETQAINKSLSALADVFAALAGGSKHVPYRNSKLTYLLQPCLSGDGKTLMIVNVSGERSDVGETVCSLRFASTVNQCTLGKPKRTARVDKELDEEKDSSGAQEGGEHNRQGSGDSAITPMPLKKPTLKASMSRR